MHAKEAQPPPGEHGPPSEQLPQVAAHRVVVLDGGLATQLEARGNDLSSALWSARLLLDNPDEIRAAHRDFFVAGAEVAITSSYQVSYAALAQLGYDTAATDRLLRLSVTLAREAAEAGQWVAASVGPYGAVLANGAEYRGDYGLTRQQLMDWHRPRLESLLNGAPDVIALETIPCLTEAEAVSLLIAEYDIPAWLALTSQGVVTRQGEPLAEAFALAEEVDNIFAVGVNCTAADQVDDVLELARRVTRKPLVVYPNSGEGWDNAARSWTGAANFAAERVTGWTEHGARLVGGCCRVTPEQIATLTHALTRAPNRASTDVTASRA